MRSLDPPDAVARPAPEHAGGGVEQAAHQHLRPAVVLAADAKTLFVGERAGAVDLGAVDAEREPAIHEPVLAGDLLDALSPVLTERLEHGIAGVGEGFEEALDTAAGAFA